MIWGGFTTVCITHLASLNPAGGMVMMGEDPWRQGTGHLWFEHALAPSSVWGPGNNWAEAAKFPHAEL